MDGLIWTLPVRSQEFERGPQVMISSGRVTLRWEAENETGEYTWSSASFVGVEDVEFTSFTSCTPEQVQAYDRLVKIEPSEKLSALRGSATRFLQHLRIFFDEIGCLDVIAEDFEPPTG